MVKRIWIFADYKQAEARVVAWRGPVPQLKQAFKENRDVHIEVAKNIGKIVQEHKLILPDKLFQGTPWQELTVKDKRERQVGKTTGHAGNYGIQKNTLALFLQMPPKYAEIILAIYHAQFPGVRQGYQRWIEMCIKKDRTIRLPTGWEKIFYDIYSDDLLKAAYAFYAQSTVGCLLTQLMRKLQEHFKEIKFDEGIIWTPERIKATGFDVRLNAHDAVGVSAPDDKEVIRYTVEKIKEYGEIPLSIEGDELIIPMDYKTGPSWGELKDYELSA